MVHAKMKKLPLTLTAIRSQSGYTLVELLMVVIIIGVLSVTFLSTQSASLVSYGKLRLAAAELAGAMAKARDTAAKNINISVDSTSTSTCSIVQTVDSTTTNVTTTLLPANCISASLLPNAINLRDRSGASNLAVDQTIVFKFLSEGMSADPNPSPPTPLLTEQTILLSDPRSTTKICVNLTIPASIIRVGLKKAGSESCDYTVK